MAVTLLFYVTYCSRAKDETYEFRKLQKVRWEERGNRGSIRLNMSPHSGTPVRGHVQRLHPHGRAICPSTSYFTLRDLPPLAKGGVSEHGAKASVGRQAAQWL
jgi:hypothetical protein